MKKIIFGIYQNQNTKLFLRYVLIAGFATLIDISLLYALTEFIGIWYFYSSIISYTSGVIPNYLLNKYFNFKNKSKKVFAQLSIWMGISLIGLIITQWIIFVFVEMFGLWYMFSKLIAIAITLFWNFYVNKQITFNLFN